MKSVRCNSESGVCKMARQRMPPLRPEKGCVPTAIVSGIWFHWLVDSIESLNVAIDDPVRWALSE